MTKRQITVPQDITLPALSTEVPSRSYTWPNFLVEWVLQAPKMRSDANLPQLFALEELMEKPAIAVGENWYIEHALWQAMKDASKDAIDEAMTPNAMGRQRIPLAWALKILRFYHVLANAQAIEDKDIPVAPPTTDAALS